MKKNIVIIGPMGSGKSRVGRLLSRKLGFRYIDTDVYIEKKYSQSINSLFESYGEDYFRELEEKVIDEIYLLDNCVISTGGGIVLRPTNIQKLRTKGLIILLKSSISTLIRNLSNSRNKRPLLNNSDWEAKLEQIIIDREELYTSSSDYIINTDNKNPYELSDEIIRIYNDNK